MFRRWWKTPSAGWRPEETRARATAAREDGVAVVEEGVEDGFAVGIAPVSPGVDVRESGGPVDFGGLGLGVFGVAGFHVFGQDFELSLCGIRDLAGLGLDFGADDGRPGALAGGAAGLELGGHAGDELGVGEGGQEGAGGEVLFVADHDGGAVPEEGVERGGGEGDGGVLEDEDADVLAGELAARALLPEVEDELPAPQGEAGGALGDLDGVLDHWPSMWRISPWGRTSTFRALGKFLAKVLGLHVNSFRAS